MLNLSQIDSLTNSFDGSVYSDLYKDVYGTRPRGAEFSSIEDFNQDFEYLVRALAENEAREAVQKTANWAEFVARVEDTMQLVEGVTRERAIEIIADAEGEAESLSFYGYERLEWHFNLQYDSIQKWLAE